MKFVTEIGHKHTYICLHINMKQFFTYQKLTKSAIQ